MTDYKDCIYHFEPKPRPITDRDGNIIGYDYPDVLPMTLEESDSIRKKTFPNELGCTADSSNVDGFAATLEVLNAHRNVHTSGMSDIGNDSCGMAARIEQTKINFDKFDNAEK